MKELKDLILSAQQHDNIAMMKIITMFDPCIGKYTRMMRYDEDTKSDLTLFLIELILTINISKIHNPNTPVLIQYINASIYHQYIRLSSKQTLLRKREKLIEREILEKRVDIDYEMIDVLENILSDALIQDILTDKEYTCIKLTIIEGYSSTEASQLLGITRQTANETKLRALHKLKKYMEI